ncbi:hypothetical protein HaLaN_29497, partial [Haematococcus lacustris]
MNQRDLAAMLHYQGTGPLVPFYIQALSSVPSGLAFVLDSVEEAQVPQPIPAQLLPSY